MCCSIFKRLLTLISDKHLHRDMEKFFNFDILSRMCGDLFHILKHKCDLCSDIDGTGLFHPYLAKYKDILKPHKKDKVNLIVCEQLWRKWNKLHWLKVSNKSHYECTLIRFQRLINSQLFNKLKKEGYIFESLKSIYPLRSISLPPWRISQQPIIKDLQCVKTLSTVKVSICACAHLFVNTKL